MVTCSLHLVRKKNARSVEKIETKNNGITNTHNEMCNEKMLKIYRQEIANL